MPSYLDTFNQFLSLGAILLQIVIFSLIVGLTLFRSHNNRLLAFFSKHTFYLGFIIAFFAVALSLFYSEVIGFPPCELCWIQRIFLYPQLILFSMELYKRDKSIIDHSIALAVLGSITSMYHIYVEHGGSSSLPCAAPSVASQVSCATRYVYEFSYVTIPVMALTLSLFIITILLNYKYMSKK